MACPREGGDGAGAAELYRAVPEADARSHSSSVSGSADKDAGEQRGGGVVSLSVDNPLVSRTHVFPSISRRLERIKIVFIMVSIHQ